MAAVDVAVIGGGIVGTSIAAFLAEGGLRVRLYERSGIAAGASGRNSGIVQHPFDHVLVNLYRRTLVEYRGLADELSSTFALPAEPAGLLLVGHDVAAARRAAEAWQHAWPETMPEVLAGDELRRLEGALAPDLVLCRLDIGLPVAPAAATEAFAALATRRGVEVVLGSEVRPVVVGGRVAGVALEGGGSVEPAGAVVVAAGPWTAEIVDPDGDWRPIRPLWGVVASIALDGAPRHALEAMDIAVEPPEGVTPTRAHADDSVDFSLVPAAGSSALGSTFLREEPDPSDWLDILRTNGSRYVPGIATAPLIGLRTCARPLSRDARPLVGPVPWLDGLWVVAGHGMWGISTGPGSARLVADAILGAGKVSAVPTELSVDRFGTPDSPGAPGGRLASPGR